MELAAVLGLKSLPDFVERHFLQTPYVAPGACKPMCGEFGWNTVTTLLESSESEWLVTRHGIPVPRQQRPSADEAIELLNSGHALRFRHAERTCPSLRLLACAFQQEFHSPIDCHVYCTGAESLGLHWHYDVEDVFVLQIEGTKEWRLRKNTVNPWPVAGAIPADMQLEREIMPVIQCKLQMGDWLYIPAGYWHYTQAMSSSISFSIGILTPTALDLLDYLRQQLPNDLLWRQRLSNSQLDGAEDCRNGLDRVGADLARRFSDPELLRGFWRNYSGAD